MLKESFLALAARAFMGGTRAVMLIIIANALGPEAQGSFGLALATATLAALFGSAGLEISTTYLSGKHPEKIGSLVFHVVTLGVISGIVTAFLTYGVIEFFSDYFENFPSSFSWAIPVTVFGEVLFLYFGAILLGSRDFASYFWVTIIRYGTIILILIVAAFLNRLNTSFLMPLWALGGWLGVIYSLVRAGGLALSRSSRFVFDWALLKEQVIEGKNAYINNLVNWLNHKVDLFILAAYLDITSVGYYSMSITIAEGLLYVPKGLGSVAIARASSLGSAAKVHKLYQLNSLLMGVVSIGLFVFSPFIIPWLMGEAFRPSVPSFRVIVPGIFALSTAIIASNHLFGMGKTKIPSQGAIINLAVTLGLDLLLIPRFGLIGAALAATLGYTAYAIYLIAAVMRHSEYRLKDLFLPTVLDLSEAKARLTTLSRTKKQL